MSEETSYYNEIRKLHNRIMAINDEVLSTPTADPTNMSFLSAAAFILRQIYNGIVYHRSDELERIDRRIVISGMANAITYIIRDLYKDEPPELEAIMRLHIARSALRKTNSKLRASRGMFA
ncbi:MAG: hypothetical protein J7K40_13860 [candidate division Zixibacteria bacterium]|nr:hypothetical protein [candidate division Zixibacteria bacterium]